MALDEELAKRVVAEIDRDELAQLGADLANILSPTGQEKDVAYFILAWFRSNGVKAGVRAAERSGSDAADGQEYPVGSSST